MHWLAGGIKRWVNFVVMPHSEMPGEWVGEEQNRYSVLLNKWLGDPASPYFGLEYPTQDLERKATIAFVEEVSQKGEVK